MSAREIVLCEPGCGTAIGTFNGALASRSVPSDPARQWSAEALKLGPGWTQPKSAV